MPFQKGNQLNKAKKRTYKLATLALMDALEVLDFSPLHEMHRIYWKLDKLVCKYEANEIMKAQAQINILSELMGYLYPKRKAVEVSVDINQQPNIVWDFRFGDGPSNRVPTGAHTATIEAETVKKKV